MEISIIINESVQRCLETAYETLLLLSKPSKEIQLNRNLLYVTADVELKHIASKYTYTFFIRVDDLHNSTCKLTVNCDFYMGDSRSKGPVLWAISTFLDVFSSNLNAK